MSGSSIEFRHYFQAVVKRFWLVLLLVALAVGGMYWRTTSQKPKYTATATVMVATSTLLNTPFTTAGSSQSTGATAFKGDPNTLNSIITLMTANPVTERVAKSLGLSNPKVVKDSLKPTKVPNTNLIALRASSTDRTLAPKIANAGAQQFVAYWLETNRGDARHIRLFVENRLTQSRSRLEASDRMIQTYKQRYGIADLDDTISETSEELSKTKDDLEATALRLKEDEAKLATSAKRLEQEKLTRVTMNEIDNNPVFDQLQTTLTNLEITKAEMAQRYTPLHPKMQEIEGQIADVKKQFTAQAQRVVGKEVVALNPVHEELVQKIVDLQIDRGAALARMEALSFSQRRKQAAVMALPAIERGMTALLRENKILDESYTMLSEKYQEALLRENEAGYVPAAIHVVEAAVAPKAADAAKLPLRAGIAGLVGLVLGIMAAVLLETSDDKIRTAQDAERTLGAPVLAKVPDMSPQRAPAGAALIIGLLLTLLVGSSVVAARVTGESSPVSQNAAVSMLARLGRSIDSLTGVVGHAIR